MKKIFGISIIVMTAIIAMSMTKVDIQDKATNQVAGEFVIIKYFQVPIGYRGSITIFYGGDKFEDIELTKEETKKGVSNYIVDLLTKFNSQGYEIISTTSAAPDQITCYLKKK